VTLRELGVEPLPEKVYRALLSDAGSTLDELSRMTGTNVHSVELALSSLVTLQILEPDVTAACGAVARHPGTALAGLVERRESELAAQQREVERARAEVARLCAEQVHRAAAADASAAVETLDHPGAVAERVEELAFFARSSVSCVHPRSWVAESWAASVMRLGPRPHLAARVIHEPSQQHEPVATGVQVRTMACPVEHLLVVDGAIAVVPWQASGRPGGALVIAHPGLLNGLVALFDTIWDAAGRGAGSPGPSPEDRALLTLLAEGRTDESIAREIAISVRQLRRRITSVMARLNATSRFEAGVLAAGRGWV
jgi:DNA-binding CsgD family transcriptional regulator